MASVTHDSSALHSRLAAVLPKGHDFGVYHVSTPPVKSSPLYSPPPNERPERTYCENHFLAITIDAPAPDAQSDAPDDGSNASPKKQVLALAIEIFIYSTARSTTLFVSKADSTGYLSLLGLPKGTPSPIRETCATVILYLVEKRWRQNVQFIVSLFARAQAQYLFPGSVDNGGKHVLDDRGLVRWWCRVLNPLLGPAAEGSSSGVPWHNANGYLVVPGLEPYETKALVPRTAAGPPSSWWKLTHPLERISHYYREFDWVPPRCLIPHFPDDPKSRFRDELDQEAAGSGAMKTTGSWNSVKTLDTFWEMMAYRQECSSGRMTGFTWVVFDDPQDSPQDSNGPEAVPTQEPGSMTAPETPKKQRSVACLTPSTTPRKLFPSRKDARRAEQDQKKKKSKAPKKKKRLRGPIIPRAPRAKTTQRNYLLDRPEHTPYYSWGPQGRGDRIVNENSYKRIVELLLHLDFATLNKAAGSTRRWLSEVAVGGSWGTIVTGTRELPAAQNGVAGGAAPVNNLSGLIKRKRSDSSVEPNSKVNVLGAGLVKRKPKEEEPLVAESEAKPAVNMLSGGLVRKKPKASA